MQPVNPSHSAAPPSTPSLQHSITPFSLMLRSLRFYWRTNVGVVLGVAVAGAILTGALVVVLPPRVSESKVSPRPPRAECRLLGHVLSLPLRRCSCLRDSSPLAGR